MDVTLPNFLVIGAYKSATTSLHHALRRHPQVYVPERKEPSFFAFDGNPELDHPALPRSVTTLDEYERLFDRAAGKRAVGEVSPEYLANPWACARIRERIPDARLVAILRNPVERAFSDYLMYVRDGREPLRHFGEALAQQEARYRRREPTGYYLRTGFYARQLRPYLETFGPDQLQVHLYEDLRSQSTDVVARICSFVGADPRLASARLPVRNASAVPRNRAAAALFRSARRLSPSLEGVLPSSLASAARHVVRQSLQSPTLHEKDRQALVEIYRDDVLELQELLGRPLGHWL